MAGIDKIYGTLQQRKELEDWLNKNQKPINCYTGCSFDENNVKQSEYEDCLPTEYLYPLSLFYGKYKYSIRPISNFPEEIDEWLRNNCPIDFVQQRLKEQYG